jgi:TolB-like protein/Flp pilus assembly protein TadD
MANDKSNGRRAIRRQPRIQRIVWIFENAISLGDAGALALAVLLGAVWWFKRDSTPKQANEIRSLAVLSFKPLTGADADQTLGLGLADALITHLGSTGRLMVRPTSAILKYTAPDANLAKIGDELDVEAVLDGRVQQSGGRLRLTVQLVRAADDAPLWAESFDEEFTNLLTVQKTISEQVARLLTLKLTAAQEQRLARNYMVNTEAFQAYLRGRNFEFQRRPEQLLQQAVKEYERAITLDPAYALAYTGISDCCFRLSLPPFMMGEPPEPAPFAKARAAALKAVELDPGLSDAHASLGAILAYENDAACHRAYERALELNPHNPRAYQYYALHLFADNRPQEAFEKLQRAVAIDPLSAQLNSALGVTLYRLRRSDEAITKVKQTEKLDPNFFRTYWGLGLAYAQAGLNEAAVAAFQRAVELTNNGPLMLGALAFGLAKAGRRAEAEQTLAQIEKVQPPKRGTAYWVAAACVGLGKPEGAFEWLEKAGQEGAYRLILIEPIFDSLRADPRYVALLGE